MHTFDDCKKHTIVKVGKNVSNDEESVKLIVSLLLTLERKILSLSG